MQHARKDEKAKFSFSDGSILMYPPPCRSLEKIMFTYEDYSRRSMGGFAVSAINLDSTYKEVVMKQVNVIFGNFLIRF